MNAALLLLALAFQEEAEHSFASKIFEFIVVEGVVTESKEIGGGDGILEIEVKEVGLGASSLVGKKFEAQYESRFKVGSRFRYNIWAAEAAVKKESPIVVAIRFDKSGAVITDGWVGDKYRAYENSKKLVSQLKSINSAKTIPEIRDAAFEALKKGCSDEHFIWNRIGRSPAIWTEAFGRRISDSNEHPGALRRHSRVVMNAHRPDWAFSDERLKDLIDGMREAEDPRTQHDEVEAFLPAMAKVNPADAERWKDEFCKVVLELAERRDAQFRVSTILLMLRLGNWPQMAGRSNFLLWEAVFRIAAEVKNHDYRERVEDALLEAAQEGTLDIKKYVLSRLEKIDAPTFQDQLKAAVYTPSERYGEALKFPGSSAMQPPLPDEIELSGKSKARPESGMRERAVVIGEFVIARELDSNLVETYVKINEVIKGPSDWVGKRTVLMVHPKPRGKGIRRWHTRPTPDWFAVYLNDQDVRCWEIDLATGWAVGFTHEGAGEIRRANYRFAKDYERVQRKNFGEQELREKEEEWLQLILQQKELFWRRTEADAYYSDRGYRGASLHPLASWGMVLLSLSKKPVDPEFFQRASQNERYSLLLAAFAGQAMLEQPDFAKSEVVKKLVAEFSEKGRSVEEAIALVYLLKNGLPVRAVLSKVEQELDGREPVEYKQPFDIKPLLTRALDAELHSLEYRLAIAHTMRSIRGDEARSIMREIMIDQVSREPPRQLDVNKLPTKETVSDTLFCEFRMGPFFKSREEFEALTARMKPEVRAVLEADHQQRLAELAEAESKK